MAQSIDDILAGDDEAYDHVVTAKIPRVPVALRHEHEALEALLPSLTSDTIDLHPDYRATVERISEIEAEIEASVIEIELQGIGYQAWMDLEAKHPPTAEQVKANRGLPYNPRTFQPAAIAASCVNPSTASKLQELRTKRWWTMECDDILWSACCRVNLTDPVPKSLAASVLRRSAESAKRRTTTESREASSLDE